MNFTYSKSFDVTLRPDVLVCGAGLRGDRRGGRGGARRREDDGGGADAGFAGASSPRSSDRPSTGSTTSTPVCRRWAAWCSRCSSGWASCRGATRARCDSPATARCKEIAEPARLDGAADCDPERFKKAADEILNDAGVDVHLPHAGGRHGHARRAHRGGHGQQQGAAWSAMQPKVVVDCTGDGDVAAWAGAPFELSDAAAADEPALPGDQRRADAGRCARGARRRWREAHARGELGNYGGPWMHRFAPNEIYFNAVRVRGQRDRSRRTGRASSSRGGRTPGRCSEISRSTLPEFKDAYFFQSGPVAGGARDAAHHGRLRADRRGHLGGRSAHDDVVVLGAGRIDRHAPNRRG